MSSLTTKLCLLRPRYNSVLSIAKTRKMWTQERNEIVNVAEGSQDNSWWRLRQLLCRWSESAMPVQKENGSVLRQIIVDCQDTRFVSEPATRSCETCQVQQHITRWKQNWQILSTTFSSDSFCWNVVLLKKTLLAIVAVVSFVVFYYFSWINRYYFLKKFRFLDKDYSLKN